jgi:hypothetical protein
MPQRSSSISNSNYKAFLSILLTTFASGLILSYAFILVVDPYDVFSWSPDFDRYPVGKSRLHKPAQARSKDFDSVILGTSSVMLLNPKSFDKALGTNFVNLSLPAGSPYEQLRIAELFHRHHDKTKAVIISVTDVWCRINGTGKYLNVNRPKLMDSRKIKEWMYTDSIWGQLPPLDSDIFEDTVDQIKILIGKEEPEYSLDGYNNFVARYERKYSKERRHNNLYGSGKRKKEKEYLIQKEVMEKWGFPDLTLLENYLSGLDDDVKKVLLFAPNHFNHGSYQGSHNKARIAECKRRVDVIRNTVDNTRVVDFMFESPISLVDSNFYDPRHYTIEIADMIVKAIIESTHLEEIKVVKTKNYVLR